MDAALGELVGHELVAEVPRGRGTDSRDLDRGGVLLVGAFFHVRGNERSIVIHVNGLDLPRESGFVDETVIPELVVEAVSAGKIATISVLCGVVLQIHHHVEHELALFRPILFVQLLLHFFEVRLGGAVANLVCGRPRNGLDNAIAQRGEHIPCRIDFRILAVPFGSRVAVAGPWGSIPTVVCILNLAAIVRPFRFFVIVCAVGLAIRGRRL
mmetsp:Transcript_2440/g.5118  ORF Transcript_2440/g.5118 Transcript_2440/m.5118 type:complete len:212 (+) Transcript_2440:397-1032(+)